MRNFKHSIVALIAIAMISSLAAVQASDIKEEKIARQQRLNAAAETASITIAQKDVSDAVKGVALTTNEEEAAAAVAEEATAEEVNAKSYHPLGYVTLTSGTLSVKAAPSADAETTDELDACKEVEVLENSEGWYRVLYDGDKAGYVQSEYITEDKADAEYAAMHYDHYKYATVSVSGNELRVREQPSTESAVLDTLDDQTQVIILWGEDDFIRICYGDDFREGYVINTGLELTGEWVEKSYVSQKQQEIAEEKARKEQEEREAAERAARAEEAARRHAAEAASSSSSSYSSSSASSDPTPVSSSGGQALVDTAMQYLGVPYVWGGTSPSGFDCSGLVQYVCRKNGISVSRVAADQRGDGTYVSRDNLQPGDLVFFDGGSGIHHVGIYIGNGNMIHAPQTGDVVKISSIDTSYRINQYAGAVRVW